MLRPLFPDYLHAPLGGFSRLPEGRDDSSLINHPPSSRGECLGLRTSTPAQLDKIAQGVVVDELKADLRRAIMAERVKTARLDPRRPFDPQSFQRGTARAQGEAKGGPEELLIAWLKTRLARLCTQLMLDGKLSAVCSWHDLRHVFAQW